MADPVEPASSSPTGFHRVRRGETISSLAAEYGVTARQIRTWNVLGPNEGIRAGQRLRVAPPAARRRPATVRVASEGATTAGIARTHTVRRGETLTGLAKRYGVSVQALRDANGLSGNDGLRAGLTIRIPG
jgi:LysM repeat protein